MHAGGIGGGVEGFSEEQIARECLERYSGSACEEYQPYLLLTNFSYYVHYFAEQRKLPIHEGSMFKVVHSPSEKISLLDFKFGSPAAAFVIDLCSQLPIKASCMLGMCGGLRRHYRIGDYFVPIASIRGEGTSDFYFDSHVPALANFVMQKVTTNVLEEHKISYHIGITHTTNKRFWEFNQEFRGKLARDRSQAIEMECATLFIAGYSYKFPVGALLLISDLPLETTGVKTKKSSEHIFTTYTSEHVECGVKIMRSLDENPQHIPKGLFRGARRRFAREGS